MSFRLNQQYLGQRRTRCQFIFPWKNSVKEELGVSSFSLGRTRWKNSEKNSVSVHFPLEEELGVRKNSVSVHFPLEELGECQFIFPWKNSVENSEKNSEEELGVSSFSLGRTR